MRRRRFIACWVAILLLAVGLSLHAQTIVGPNQMNTCDEGTFTTTITNASVTQYACLLVIARSYTEVGVLYVPGSTTITLHDATELTDDPTDSSWDLDALLGSAYTLPPTESITITYKLETTCAAVSGTEQVTVHFEDCADPGVPLQNVSSTSIELLPGAIVVSKLPSVQDASVGETVTWTITVENTGLGRVSNLEITDVLGPGLAYSSSTGGGSNAGQTTTWDGGSLEVGETISVTLTAEVIACTGLYNDVDAAFGCGPADVCFDTAVDDGTATASLNLIVNNPALSFTPPDITLGYCTGETQVQIPITNSGAGWARNVELCCAIHIYEVDLSRLPAGVTYAGGCFTIPDIEPGTTLDLDFFVLHPDVDWCSGPPGGVNTFELTYANDCGIPFVAYPQFSNCSSESGPSIAVSKTGPDSLRLGETASYDLAVEYVGSVDCGGGSPGPVTIVDTYPEGFTVVDPAGGTVDGGARTIAWAYDPTVDPPFAETIQIQAPSDCGYCAQPGGGSDANSITATGTDCCGCPITGEASADTTILCEGFGDDVAYFSSTMELDRTATVRCSEDYAVTVTHTYAFIDDPALDDLLLNEFTYFVDGGGDLQYSAESASVAGATLGTASDSTPVGRLELPLIDSTSVRGKTIVYTYTLIALGLDDPSCQESSYPIDAGIELIGDPTAIGLCGTMYADPDQRPSITAQPPAMSVAIDGVPVIQEYCATYDVTITLTRVSTLAKPYDVRLVMTNSGGSILGFSQAVCGGSVSPTDGTTCTAPIETATTAEWRFADAFDDDADVATITFPVTIPCGGPLADLSVVATFDDLCDDDDVYDNECSTSASDEASLSLSANVFTRKSPEILYATTRDVQWSLVVHNTGNGTAYNVWVDDVLGSGLVFDQISTNPAGASVTASQDHAGAPINGASFLFDEIGPGVLKTITFAADLVACTGLTNHIAVAWGCGGADCQVPRTDDSIVVIPPAKLVATSFSPTPIPMCSDNPAIVTVKNAGVTTVYNIIDAATLPAGLVYLGNPEVRVNGGGWSATGAPAAAGQTLTWTQTETPELAEATPKDVIEIRFDYTVFCGFAGGNLEFQATYEGPCGNTKLSNIGRFALGLTPADVTVSLRQISPAAGESIDCGGEATWEIDVENVGSSAIPVVEVEAILGDGLSYVGSQGDPTYGPADGGSNVGQSVHWEVTDLPIDAVATLRVTAATVGGGLDCEALDIDVDAAWGCGAVDGLSTTFDAECTTTFPSSGSIAGNREPPLDLSASLSPGSIEACDDTTQLTLTITNTGTVSSASDVSIEIALPSELSYLGPTSATWPGGSSIDDPTGAPGPDLTWDLGATLGPGETLTLTFDVDSACFFANRNIPITVRFYDCCGLTQYDASTQVALTSLLPQLSVDKSPANTDLDCYNAGDTVTWTVTVENTGTGTADWVRLVDTLGSNLVVDSFTDLVDETPSTVATGSQVGQTITWEADVSLAPGGSLSTTVTAHATQPSNDCSRSLRRNSAAATWGCGTLAAPTCEYGTAVQDQSTVRVPNLTIAPADITPIFECAGDGITPGSGKIELVVRNSGTGDAAITEDFTITISEPNASFGVSNSFTGLGGSLPLNDDSPQTLTFNGWDVACAECEYAITVTLDAGGTICECAENDNQAVLAGSITLPDLAVHSADLSVTCASDGQLRIQGPVTLRNDGCGDPVTEELRLRFRLFDGPDCTGNEINTFTETWTAVDIASGGGTFARDVDRVRSLDVCAVTQVSVRIEVDDNDVICECSGDNNTLCVDPFALALPDVAIVDVAVNVPDACNTGTIDVTIENTGSGDPPAGIVLRITGDASGETTAPAIASGASAVVSVPLDAPLVCGPKSITVTVDPESALCECSDGSNTTDVGFTVSDPDLAVSNLIAACRPDGTIRATATVANDGDEASGDVTLRVLLDGTPIDTSVIALDPAEMLPVDVATSPVACGEEHTIRVEIDEGDAVCECDETNNAAETTATCPCPALSVDKIVTDILRDGASIGTTGPIEPGDVVFYRYTITNVAAGTAFAVDFADTLPTGLVTEIDAPGDAGSYVVSDPSASGSLALADGVGSFSTSIAATIGGGETLVADYTVIATSDIEQGTDLINVAATTGETADGTPIPGENSDLGDTSDGDAEDPDADDTGITVLGVAEPALSVDKTITDITRGGASIGISGPVEPGDIVFYRFVITNVGDGTAYGVEFTDTLPPGMVTVAGGSYAVSAPAASGSLALPDAVAAFTSSIDATIDGGETLTADFSALVTSGIVQGVDLVNTAEATGFDGFGTEIPDANSSVGDTSDGDAEDPDADDTGIAVIGADEPALSVDKIITDIVRRGSSIGDSGPVEPGDVIFYRYTIRNVGLGTAYAVDFTDTLPVGLVTEADAPGDAGTYIVDDPADSGTLSIADGVGAFTTSIGATIAGGGRLVAEYAVYVTSAVQQGVDLVNVAAATGIDGAGNPIPGENADVGDTSDDDAEDSDADDTGITVVAPAIPALDVDKRVVDVIRGGASIGVVDPVLYGDVIVYEYTIRNVGPGTAYAVDFTDALPAGLVIETASPIATGDYVIDAPSASGSLNLADGVSAFTTSIDATIAGGGTLTATYAALVTPAAPPALDLINVAETTGEDGAGTEIPDENADVGDTSDADAEDPDADDTGIASVRVGAPALVTTKRVASIVRGGLIVNGELVEPGDTVIYEVTVTNVGDGPAQAVDLSDGLPDGFLYDGNTDASWPGGTSTSDPTGAPGPSLVWPLGASLDAGETLTLRFDAHVTSDIAQGSTYTNTITAIGEDGVGRPIPPDSSLLVPEDDDPDDSSDVSLIGAVPALVTDKLVLDVVRDGRSLGPATSIESADLVVYDLRITNVGGGTAYAIDVRDTLPAPFAYRSGTTTAAWPLRIGTYAADPLGAPGPTLAWRTNADLGSGDTLALRFTATVDGPIAVGLGYNNVLTATGEDGGGHPIPPNRAGEVPEDDDPDDRDEVTLTGGVEVEVPALVTTKSVSEIRRGGVRVNHTRIEEGDTVVFELMVRNVGTATAFAVGIDDELPIEFTYDAGSTNAQWPNGSSSADPAVSGTRLTWSLNATLQANDRIVLRFDARVLGPLFDGNLYLNRMHAFGTDGSGLPIPEDQREFVPRDVDPDDASQVSLIARSSVMQGVGGEIIPVPILRKQAEILGDGVCEGSFAEADRLWFQTDIAMYASSEFELLDSIEGELDLRPETLLPNWLRTVRAETADDALDNLLQVNALSGIGITLSDGLRIRRHADALSLNPLEALEDRLTDLARRAGLDPAERPAGEDWIVLEFAGGEPIYEASADGVIGPYGDWTVLDEQIVASALGMGLVKQAMEASSLLSSARPLDRYIGFVLAEAMANKILALDGILTVREDAPVPYVPHVHVANTDGLTVEEDASHLFDQLSLLWGLAEFARFVQERPDAWSPEEPGLRAYLHARASQLIGEILTTIEVRHLSAAAMYLGIADDALAEEARASTIDVSLLLVALDATADVVGPFDAERVDLLATAATADLLSREENGRFLEPGTDPDLDFWALAQQLAGIRGLLVASGFAQSEELVTIAQSAFDVLDERLWIDAVGSGLYAAYRFDGEFTYCYTPLEIGLATGALRELASRSDEARSAEILVRLSSFVRSVVDDAALQLSNAIPSGSELTVGTGRGTIGALRYDADEGPLAPVLQQRLCLEVPDDGSPCSGQSTRVDEPWYQTDISMYAAYVLQDRMPQIEDYADANLSAVVLHSTLGVGFGAFPNLREALDRDLDDADLDPATSLDPIAVPFASGSPRIEDETGLDWAEATFDDRVLSSAVGMTLLRSSQEVEQLLALIEEPRYRLQARTLMASVLQQLIALQQITTSGPDGVDYFPHAARFTPDETTEWTVVDRRSTLFDQLALLYGLSEAHALLRDPRALELIDVEAFPQNAWGSLTEELITDVLATLERVHLDPIEHVLVDEASFEIAGWVRDRTVTTSMLGLTAAALEHTIDRLASSEIQDRARSLLADEVGFLQRALWEGPGVYAERWPDTASIDADCEPRTLIGQLGALRALLAGNLVLDLDAAWAIEAVQAIDARFWDEAILLYPSRREAPEWCVTPLEVGLTIDALDRAAALLDREAAARLRDRLSRHVDRVLDALWVQLPSSSALSTPREDSDGGIRFAPVFDRSVCLRPRLGEEGAGWAEPGDLVRYTVTAENRTDETFANVVLEDLLPEGVSLVSTDPIGTAVDRTVTWSFDRFEPLEIRTWSLVARVDEDVPVGEVLENCATLTYTDLDGNAQPMREACAETTIPSAQDALEESLDRAVVSYATDEAMRLATALETLSRWTGEDWTASAAAHEISVANLGILLGESGLGVALEIAPGVPAGEDRSAALESLLTSLAESAGWSRPPDFGAPVFVPFESGTPILRAGIGFIEKADTVTPAALGWTLAREAAFLVAPSADTRLGEFLRRVVGLVATSQLAWLTGAMQPADDGESVYLPRSVRPSILGQAGPTIVDPSTSAYGQASLLLGLTRIAQVETLDEETRRLAQQLATETLKRLQLHWDTETKRLLQMAPLEESADATWVETAAVAEALAEGQEVLVRDRASLLDLLQSLGELALNRGTAANPIEEAGRLSTLLRAAAALGAPRFAEAARTGWQDLHETAFDESLGRLVFSPAIRPGWPYTPEELAVVFEMLSEVGLAFPEERLRVFATATRMLEQDILAARVQLTDASEYWSAHLAVTCLDLPPVFARHFGQLPALR